MQQVWIRQTGERLITERGEVISAVIEMILDDLLPLLRLMLFPFFFELLALSLLSLSLSCICRKDWHGHILCPACLVFGLFAALDLVNGTGATFRTGDCTLDLVNRTGAVPRTGGCTTRLVGWLSGILCVR